MADVALAPVGIADQDSAAIRESLSRRLASWARGKWQQFKTDVWGENASVQPLAGWLLLALLGFVVYLTLAYAPGAFERAQIAHGADRKGVISVETGFWTVGLVALLALVVAFEPQLTLWLRNPDRSRSRRRWLENQPWALRLPLKFMMAVLLGLWWLPSVIWSFIDWFLARPLATLAGATYRSVLLRYSWGALIILASVGAGLLGPAPLGLYCVGFALVLVLAVVRRWIWAEDSRDAFLIERSDRGKAQRIGLQEDLRDEALVGVICLFVLIPLGLRQIQLATGNSAFELPGEMPDAPIAQFLAWLGYFGAELAKSVPFVDWSEVFHVANDSPIKPRTTLGAQVVFTMRAALDLLLLAAVVKAVQIAGRLRDQDTAFRINRLPILEPFAEARELRYAASRIVDAFQVRPTEQPAIANFPRYDQERLRELMLDEDHAIDPKSRRAAVALLARQHRNDATDELFTKVAAAESDKELRSWAMSVASGLAADPDASQRHSDIKRLKELLTDRREEIPMRAAAARALGRMQPNDTVTSLLLERLEDEGEDLAVCAAAGVSLAKAGMKSAASLIHKLPDRFKGPLEDVELIAVMATAYACARFACSENPEGVAKLFDGPLRQHALRAARIQPSPTDIVAAMKPPPRNIWDQTVLIEPGKDPFKTRFQMGSPPDDDPDETSQREVTMTRSFAIGRYPVTHEEYLGFCLATERATLQYSDKSRWPAGRVSWREAVAYCDWLNRITGELYRLPIEAEWEYACRAGTSTHYSWGPDWDDTKASGEGLDFPTDVGSYDPNAWGLSDMHGNVFEWCADPWHLNHDDGPLNDQVWLEGGDFTRRVVRGGSYYEEPRYLRSSFRDGYATGYLDMVVGFRIARTVIA